MSMDLSQRLEGLAAAWAQHCRDVSHSSIPNDYLEHPAYRELIAIGPAAVPWIMARFASDVSVPWEYVLQEITGERMIDDPRVIDGGDLRRRRVEWWNRERSRWPGE